MPGLSFLAKKSWHTKNLSNVEQVWVAEQQDAKEKKKIAEFEKQIKEERQIQELRELQAANGNAVKMVDNSLDWMYEGPSGSAAMQAESSEEYLLGKIFKGKDPSQVNAAAVVAPGGDPTWMRKVASKNDAFTRVHEDPILFIKQQEKLKRDAVVNNPLKMEKVRNIIAAEMEKSRQAKAAKKQAKKEKKEAKKEKKRKHKDEKKKSKAKEDHPLSASSSDSSSGGSDTEKQDRQKDEMIEVQEEQTVECRSSNSNITAHQTSTSSSRSTDRSSSQYKKGDDRQQDQHESTSTTDRYSDRKRESVNSRDRAGYEVDREGGRKRDSGREKYRDDRRNGGNERTYSSSRGDRDRDRDREEENDRRYCYRDGDWGSRDFDRNTKDLNRYERSSSTGHDRRRNDSRDRNSSSSYFRDDCDRRSDYDRECNRDRYKERDDGRDRRRDRGRGRDRDRSREWERERGTESRGNSRENEGTRERSRSRDRSQNRKDSKGNHYVQPGLSGAKPPDSLIPVTKLNTNSVGSSSSNHCSTEEGRSMYGLDSRAVRHLPHGSSSGSGSSSDRRSYVGPNPELLKSKMDKEHAERDAKFNSRKSSVNVKALSEQEKERRLLEMQQDAMINDARRLQRVVPAASSEEAEEANSALRPVNGGIDDKYSGGADGLDPLFLSKMRSEVYTSANSTSLQDRLQQNKHYTQGSSSLNSNGFTQK